MKDHPEITLEDYDRLLWKLAHRFYARIPEAHKGSVDVEDLHAIGAEQFLYAREMFYKRRGAKRPFPTLLTYSVSNRLRDVLKSMRYLKRNAVTVSYDDPDSVVVLPVLPQFNPGAAERVQRFYALASDELRETLDLYVFGGQLPDRSPTRVFSRFQGEVAWLAERTSATVEDFLSVIR